MKYVRNIEDLKKYTFEFFDSFLSQNLSDQMVNYFLLGIGNKEDLESQAANVLSQSTVELDKIAEYGEAILQLNDYQDLLKKYTELLLKSHQFEHLCAFLNRIFLQQIGDAKYKSNRRQYSIKERYFDRFVEIVMFCHIEKILYTPFFLAIFNSDAKSLMFDYKEPLKEYLDIFLKEGDDEGFISSLLSSDNKNGISEYANQNTIKTLSVLLNGFVHGEITSSAVLKQALNSHRQEGLNIIEALLQNDDSDVRYKATQLLILINDERRVKDRLKYLYENTTDAKIKTLLEKECNFNSLVKFKNSEEFYDFVDKAVTQIQERLYGARLKRYYAKFNLDNTGINGKTLTFVMETFKNREADTQLIYLKDFFKYVDAEILSKLSWVVFEVAVYRQKLASSKWALRLISVFADSQLIEHMSQEIKIWLEDKKTKETAKYFLDLLSECARDEIVVLSKKLLENNTDKKQIKFLQNKISNFCLASKQNIEEVKDKLSNDLGFNNDGTKIINLENRVLKAQINLDMSVSLYNNKTGKNARIKDNVYYEDVPLKKYIKNIQKQIKEQKKRLYQAFLEFRNYDVKSFEECIVKNPLLNFLSQHLIWARYKKDKLAQVCAFKNNKLVHLLGTVISENFEDYTIALLQPLDAQDQKERIKEKVSQSLFNQLDFPVFNLKDYNANSIDSLSGMFCNTKLFITRLQKLKYKVNDLDIKCHYSTLVKENKNLNLLTSVEFEKVALNLNTDSTTISKVRFFDLNKQQKTGKTYNLNKLEAKTVSEIDPRVLSNELAQIFLACKS
ncbi:MAG: DUF4132 domain-containing protein [Clostridia bacterium]|nr:DUF4132 domain-containing protein [Clostridia bacterium]